MKLNKYNKMPGIRYILCGLIFISIFPELKAQSDCTELSFLTPLEGQIRDTTIIYGRNSGYLNNTVNLAMNVYWVDTDDTAPRPLVILAHGGGFVFGNRTDMRARCEAYASLGYVCATISYRLYPVLLALTIDSATVVDVAINAINDMRGSVRWFKADAENGNIFNIDPTRIIVGGYSAGGIMALQTGLLQESDEISDELRLLVESKGGLEGNTGDTVNLLYNSNVQGVINLSGAMFDREWVTGDDPVLTSIHGLNDTTVPHDNNREGAYNKVTVYGSTELHDQANLVGLENYYTSIPNGGHGNIYSAAQFADQLAEFELNALLMMKSIACGELITNISGVTPEHVPIALYPNPSHGIFTLETEKNGHRQIHLYDGNGRLLHHVPFKGNKITVEKPNLKSGWYILHVFHQGTIEATKVLIIE